MNTRQKIIGLAAALPLAGLLATGGVALAQTTGAPAGTRVVQQAVTQQAVTQRAGDPCPQHAVKVAVQPAHHQLQARDRDRDCANCADRQQAQTAARTMEHARDGGCDQQADR